LTPKEGGRAFIGILIVRKTVGVSSNFVGGRSRTYVGAVVFIILRRINRLHRLISRTCPNQLFIFIRHFQELHVRFLGKEALEFGLERVLCLCFIR